MRIGLLTYHWVANYGANLQMYSTYCFLKNNGYNPIVINWIPQSGKKYYQCVAGEIQMRCHLDFLYKNCDVTREFCDSEEYPLVLQEYHISHVIVGSDSVFNIMKNKYDWIRRKKIVHTVDHSFPNPFWCNNISIPHAALSVSSQNANYKEFQQEREEIGTALKNFCRITVRDKWTQEMVSYFTNGNITPDVTPDPVFGFNTNVKLEVSLKMLKKKFDLPDKYVLFTFNNGRMSASSRWISKIKKLFNESGYACVFLPRSTGGQILNLDYNINMPIDPLDWYYLIKYSNGYIGVLMHPIVVCLHNSIPCFSFDHYGDGPLFLSKKRSSKIFDIMEKANLLENHYFLKNHMCFPSPQFVHEHILRFPYENVSKFATSQQEFCLSNMTIMLNELLNSER